MASPFLIYFAGVGTVIAALGIGFSGGWVLSSSEPAKERAAKLETVKQDSKQDLAAKPDLPLAAAPVTVRTAEENAARAAEPSPDIQSAGAKPADVTSIDARPAETDGRAAPGVNWVAMPPRQNSGTQGTSVPVKPITAPLDPPGTPAANAPPQAEPAKPADAKPVERSPADVRPADAVKPAPPKAEHRLRQADERRPDERRYEPRRAERHNVIVTEPVSADDEPEVAPPPAPPMRDSGALRGF